MEYQKPKVIAEIGCNHKGSLEIAKELIKLAKESNVDVAKFQKRTPRELLSKKQYNEPHPNPMHSYGDTYGAHREFLEFNIEEHKELSEFCKNLDIDYSTSVWDVTAAKEIIERLDDIKFLKIPSACNTNMDLLEILRDDFDGDIHISLGMTTRKEEDTLLNFFEKKNCAKKIILYACTSGYPVPFENVHLLEIRRIIEMYSNQVKAIGFSGHHLGIAIDVSAYTLGATWIERHFTKDRTWKGTDHAASLEPTGLRKLVRDLNATYNSLSYKPSEIIELEMIQRKKLKYRQNK